MKRLLIGLCIIASGAFAEVEYGTLIGDQESVTLAEGEIFIVMANNFNLTSLNTDIALYYPPSATTYISLKFNVATGRDSVVVSSSTDNFGTVVGPCRIELFSSTKYCSYKIIRPDAVVCTSPMNIISLPDDNNGDVDLLVESSTDLQNWTPVYSGSAGTSNNAAFFRTRLIEQ